MKRPFFVIALAILLAGIVLFGVGDTVAIADTGVSENEVTSGKANNASASASIRITMAGILNE